MPKLNLAGPGPSYCYEVIATSRTPIGSMSKNNIVKSSAPPPPLDEDVVPPPPLDALAMTTAVLASAAGGAPVHETQYVTLPVLDSVLDLDPEEARVSDQPSPAMPPEAEQPSLFLQLQLSETPWPAVTVDAVALSVTEGVGAEADVGGIST